MTVPVVGALLMFALMIGPAAAARSFTRRPGHAIGLAVVIALVTVWAGIAASYLPHQLAAGVLRRRHRRRVLPPRPGLGRHPQARHRPGTGGRTRAQRRLVPDIADGPVPDGQCGSAGATARPVERVSSRRARDSG